MAIEWTESKSVWRARVNWLEICVFWDAGQWFAHCATPPIRQAVSRVGLADAQRNALRLLEHVLDGTVKTLAAVREAQK